MCKQQDGSSSSLSAADPTLSSSANTTEPSASVPQTPSDIKSSSTMQKSVSFQNVEVAQYPMELGDNPSANGLPLTLGWESDFKLIFQLEEYETSRPEPRSREQFWMPPQYREDMLSRQGVTGSEMLRTTKEMKRIQRSRNRSIKNQKWDKLHLFMEESGRKLKKVASVTSLKKPSSSINLSQLDKSSSSLSSSSSKKKRMPKSMSMTMLWSGNNNDDENKNKYASQDPLDESTRSRISIHLLHHPEDLVSGDESPTEELSDLHLGEGLHVRAVEEDLLGAPGSNLLCDPSIEF